MSTQAGCAGQWHPEGRALAVSSLAAPERNTGAQLETGLTAPADLTQPPLPPFHSWTTTAQTQGSFQDTQLLGDRPPEILCGCP